MVGGAGTRLGDLHCIRVTASQGADRPRRPMPSASHRQRSPALANPSSRLARGSPMVGQGSARDRPGIGQGSAKGWLELTLSRLQARADKAKTSLNVAGMRTLSNRHSGAPRAGSMLSQAQWRGVRANIDFSVIRFRQEDPGAMVLGASCRHLGLPQASPRSSTKILFNCGCETWVNTINSIAYVPS
jgi:hypothetical protein